MDNDYIFEQIRQGNEQALEKFTKENYISFCSVANRYVANIQEAEDIVQDVLIRLWEKKQTYTEINNLKSFVYTMIRNQSLNILRHQKRTATRLLCQPEKEENNFLNIIIEEECNRLISEAINSLGAQSAKIIRLSLQGLKNEEIATQLNISENTVKVLKYRSLKRLRILLSQRILTLIAFYL